MNKKERNRKLITQNKRNRMFNRRYSSTIKTLSKLFKRLISNSNSATSNQNKEEVATNLFNISSKLFSFLDKAVKKRVIHKNKAARRKSKIGKLIKIKSLAN